ncbi:MAG: ABC transporter substrate-binding protein [Sulfurovum sp.]|nr:ABC transporter substrate-binding protein [Sulfurovum sp.]
MIKKYLFIGLILLTVILIYLFYPFAKERKSIILGSSLPLSGVNKELGQEVLEGAASYFMHINQNKGIKGKSIELIYYDDKYEPQNTLRNTKKLINKDEVFALFGFVGTPTTKEILPIIDDIPFIAPYTGASFLRDPNKKNIVNFRSSYDEEIENIINYLHNNKDIRKFSILYQNDDYGIAGYNAIIKALKQRGLTLAGEGTYKRNTLSIKHAMHEIKDSNPEAIIIVGAYKPSARFIRDWRNNYSKKTLFAPISFVNANALVDELDGDGDNIYFSLTVPSYGDTNLDIANEYRVILSRYYPTSKPSYVSFESFLAAKAVVRALQNIKGDINRKKFLFELKNLNHDALGKIPIKYQNAQLLNKVYIAVFRHGEFHFIDQDKR